MTDVAIRVRGIGKRYEIGERGYGYKTLRESLVGAIRRPFRARKNGHNSNGLPAEASAKAGHAPEPSPRTFWALKDITFDVQRGEIVGIIGRNGAGKSTLLKILSRITDPTEGEIEIEGRVGSLLEVGTGFHPELTGRENIFLNGAILGMKRTEIAARFDEIVAFAGTEKFLDTPVKYYSSGMYVRLAFGVAAHLEPEILIVDEVLSVGDAEFQKKCLGKMGDVAHSGRTVLFVSHNMAAVKVLCERAILLNSGVIVSSGAVADVIADYSLSVAPQSNATEWPDPATAPGNENIRLSHVRVTPPDNQAGITIDTGALIDIGFENLCENINLDCTIYVSSNEGVLIFESGYIISSNRGSRCGFYHLTGNIPGHLLNAGRYSLDVLFGKDQRYALFRIDGAVSFEVENTATGRGLNMSVAPGVVRPMLSWCHSFQEECSLVKNRA
ncbi:MAG TPA: ABC transporter ATP-binding protein [Candidatus Acidoferrales bacterium]|nr:ABC transporter ATP-binding protein [Candidatus Acidoferrales bacterium]